MTTDSGLVALSAAAAKDILRDDPSLSKPKNNDLKIQIKKLFFHRFERRNQLKRRYIMKITETTYKNVAAIECETEKIKVKFFAAKRLPYAVGNRQGNGHRIHGS